MDSLFTADEQIETAKQYYKESRIVECIEELSKILKEFPGNCEVNLLMGKIYIDDGKFSDAKVYLQRALTSDMDFLATELQCEAKYFLGIALNENGAFSEAVQNFKSVIDCAWCNGTVYHLYSHFMLGVLHSQKGQSLYNFEIAMHHFNQVLLQKPDDANCHYSIAKLCLESNLGKVQKAEQHLRAAITNDPQHCEAHEDLGMLLFLKGEREKSKYHLNEASKFC